MLRRKIDVLRYQLSRNARARLIKRAAEIPNWRSATEAEELVRLCYMLPEGATVVEIGAFMGSGTVLLAGTRRMRGSGRVHSIDPFDASGDSYSAPIYHQMEKDQGVSLRQTFDQGLARNGLTDWVTVHQGTAESVGREWRAPIDMLLLDADSSPTGARAVFERWTPFLKSGGVLVITNASDRVYEPDHDGHRRLVVESVKPPMFSAPYFVGTHAFALRA